MSCEGPAWLEAFQRDFSAMLRTPLDRRTGTLRADAALFPESLVHGTLPGSKTSALDRLAVYNGQYWFRLFGVLQNEFRLTCALTGAWAFNELASAFVVETPPRGHDIAGAADGFATFIEERFRDQALRLPKKATLPGLALCQAARIDDAFRAVAVASAPDAADAAAFRQLAVGALETGRLRSSGRFVLIEEDWPLLILRRELGAAPIEQPRPLPKRHPRRVRAAIHQGDVGPRVWWLEPLQAQLFTLLLEYPLAAALAKLEESVSAPEARTLPANVRAWLTESVRLGFWSGVDPC